MATLRRLRRPPLRELVRRGEEVFQPLPFAIVTRIFGGGDGRGLVERDDGDGDFGALNDMNGQLFAALDRSAGC